MGAGTYAFSGPATVAQGVAATLNIGDSDGSLSIYTPQLSFDDGGVGGTFSDGSAGAGSGVEDAVSGDTTLTWTSPPAFTGVVTITVSNDAGLDDPPAITITVTAVATGSSVRWLPKNVASTTGRTATSVMHWNPKTPKVLS